MKLFLSIICCACLWFAGCARSEQAAIKIGQVHITAQEFEDAFKESRYAHMQDRGREKFLQQFIDIKLILLEAERNGMDKEEEFLKDIQAFWEQALLKRVVAKRNKELIDQITVNNQEMLNYYEQFKDTDFQGKSFDDVRDQVKWIVLKIKQNQAFERWTADLNKQADIHVNKALLGIQP